MVEVTDAMIEAGAAMYLDRWPNLDSHDKRDSALRAIYRAMETAKPPSEQRQVLRVGDLAPGYVDDSGAFQPKATEPSSGIDPVDTGGAIERAVMVCPQCEGEGGYPDGLDENACHEDCPRCGTNGWIVDLAALQPRRVGEVTEALANLVGAYGRRSINGSCLLPVEEQPAEIADAMRALTKSAKPPADERVLRPIIIKALQDATDTMKFDLDGNDFAYTANVILAAMKQEQG